MEADSSPHGPRRSQREKKQPKPITTVTAVPGTRRKRKHAETDDEDAPRDTDGDIEEEEEVGDEPDDDEEDEDGHVSRPKRTRKAKTGPPAKRARKEATTATGENIRKPRKPRTAKQAVDPNAPFDPEALEKATNIKADNPLFNAILNPNAALRSTAEDFLESLGQSPDAALAELVNLILRCCGSNATVDGDTAVDYDGVVDRLDDIVEDLKKTTTPAGTYPLVSKAVPFHNTKAKYNFRTHLSEFISHLIEVAADVDSLYTTPLIETLQVWLVPMSSSQIRSIRHTATVFALEVESALCEVGKQVERNVELAARQREGEKKRAKSGTTPSTKGKEKEMDARLKSLKENQAKLEEFIKEFIDGVFIHRYRDLDPVIRAECISFLTTFFSVLPSHFAANSNYLRYVGWVLSDSATQVRLAAVKALQAVYDTAGIKGQKRKKTAGAAGNNKDTGGVSLSALSHFTTRFLPRLLEIAQFDVDVSVRVAVMGVLGCVDEIGLLSDSDRNRLGTMVFSDEPRIRKGVGKFVSGVWEEWVEAKLSEVEVEAHAQAAASNRGKGRTRGGRGGRGGATGKGRGAKGKSTAVDEEVDEGKVGIKALVSLLAKWGRVLNRKEKQQGNEDDEEDEEADEEKRKAENERDTESDATRERGGVAATLAMTTTFMGFAKKADGPAVGPAGTSGVTVNRAGYDSIARGRTALAVEAVWDELDIVRDWEGILDMLVLDHSASGSENGIVAPASKRGKGKPGSKRRKMKPKRKSNAANGDEENAESEEEQTQNNDEEDDDDAESTVTRVHEAWRLCENEEGILLEVLVASMRRTRKDDETTVETITQALMKALPSLFIKYQTDENRIADVLALPTLMNLEVYLEMRETSAYSALWSDVSKQFLTHSSPYVLTTAVHTITYMLANTSLSNINSEQILELEDELATSLRAAVAGPISPPGSPSKTGEASTSKRASRDIETDHLSEDEVINLTSIILRLRILVGSRDMTAWIEESEGGKQSSAWDILSAVSERGRLAIGGEEGMVEQSLQALALHVMWKSRVFTITSTVSTKEEQIHRESLLSQRNSLLERLIEFAVGTQEVGNGIADGVKRTAFKSLLDLYILFAGLPIPDGADDMEAVALTMDDEVQWRCAGYVQAEVERYAELLHLSDVGEEGNEVNSDDEESEGGDDADEGAKDKPKVTVKKAKKTTKQAKEEDEDQTLVDENSRDRLEKEVLFLDVIFAFLRSIRVGAIHVRHGAILLAHYGRFGSSFDACAKVVIEVLKEEGIMNDQPDTIVLVITQAMKEAFTIALSARSPDESDVVALARLLASCFVIRGSQLAVLRRLEAQYVVSVQTNLLTWIANQLATHQDSGDKKGLKTSLLFFRTLIPLVGSVESRDALKIKAHLDQALAHAKVEPAATKAWEPYRAYEKRLGTVMSKDKLGGTKGRTKKKKSGALTDGEESEVERLIEDDEGAISDAFAPAEPPHPRPQRPRRNKARGKKPLEDIEENGQEENEMAEDPTTPKARPRPRRAYKTRDKASEKEVVQENVDPAAPLSPLTEEEAAPSAEVPIIPTPTQNGFVTPKKTLKRNREDDDDGDAHPSASEGPGPEQPEPPEATPAADVQIRRKRIRH